MTVAKERVDLALRKIKEGHRVAHRIADTSCLAEFRIRIRQREGRKIPAHGVQLSCREGRQPREQSDRSCVGTKKVCKAMQPLTLHGLPTQRRGRVDCCNL